MKITNVKAEIINLDLKIPIIVTFGEFHSIKTVIVKVETDEGLVGFGEASPFEFVTGESVDTVMTVLDYLKKGLIGENPIAIDKINGLMNKMIVNNSSAKAAVDIALYDIMAQKMDVPLYVLLGGDDNTYETDKTISIGSQEEMLKEAQRAIDEGFTKVKLKAGLSIDNDVRNMIAIRKKFGDDLTIRMDANQGWNHYEAIEAINTMSKFKLDAIEQPVKYWDIDGLKEIRKKITTPIMADESVHNEIDAMRLIRLEAVDVLNIKLMKSNGLTGAIKINTIAEAAGLECMIGCMAESPIGITAGAHFAAAKRNITRVDLDALFVIKPHKGIDGGVKYVGGKALLPTKSGLGVTVNF